MIEQITIEEACGYLIDAIAANRLFVLCGAGLSMAHPSDLPSAAAIASAARDKHIALHGAEGQGLPQNLEEQAEYFHERNQLENYFIRTLVDHNAFAAPPNPGHFSVADLALTHAAAAIISANVDSLIETAGLHLFGEIEVVLDGELAAACPHGLCPLLKIHGCWSRDRSKTVWTARQLEDDVVGDRVQKSSHWLQQVLVDKDLLVVGFWSDWSYLNAVLEGALGAVLPARMTVFDPAPTEALAEKAPQICTLGMNDNVELKHVQTSGAVALETLRIEFSKSVFRRVLHAGRDEYEAQSGIPPTDEMLEAPPLDAESLWLVRRDLAGCKPNKPALDATGQGVGDAVGMTVIQLRAAGATHVGPYWLLNDCTVRVINTPNEFLHRVQAAYERERSPIAAADVTICVGAEASELPGNVARSGNRETITRGGPAGKWLTRSQAIAELGL